MPDSNRPRVDDVISEIENAIDKHKMRSPIIPENSPGNPNSPQFDFSKSKFNKEMPFVENSQMKRDKQMLKSQPTAIHQQ